MFTFPIESKYESIESGESYYKMLFSAIILHMDLCRNNMLRDIDKKTGDHRIFSAGTSCLSRSLQAYSQAG